MAPIGVKNTFVTVMWCSEEEEAGSARRHSSAPPLRGGRREHGAKASVSAAAMSLEALPRSGGDDAAEYSPYSSQLRQLNGIASGQDTPSWSRPRSSSPSSADGAATFASASPSEEEQASFMMPMMPIKTMDSTFDDTDFATEASFPEPCSSHKGSSSWVANSAADEDQGSSCSSGPDEALRNIDMHALRTRIPRQSDGSLTSVGSVEHLVGRCKPCAFMNSKVGCRFGILCDFCHFAEGHPTSIKVRFCKGKRDRFRKAIERERASDEGEGFGVAEATAAVLSATAASASSSASLVDVLSRLRGFENAAAIFERAMARLDAGHAAARAARA